MFPVGRRTGLVRFRTVRSFDGQTLSLHPYQPGPSGSLSSTGNDAESVPLSYEIGAFLGGGAAGVVYEALHPPTQKVRRGRRAGAAD
jgi:hypothetical protein